LIVNKTTNNFFTNKRRKYFSLDMVDSTRVWQRVESGELVSEFWLILQANAHSMVMHNINLHHEYYYRNVPSWIDLWSTDIQHQSPA